MVAVSSTREVREGLPAAVVSAGPPPSPKLDPPWRLRAADPASGDPELVAGWMALPHVDKFWDQPWPASRWARAWRLQLDGDYTLPCLVLHDGAALAYLEVYRTPRDVVGLHYPAGPYDLGVHLAIGPIEGTGRGLGRALMRAVAVALLAADPRCERIIVDPDAAHVVARRMFAAAGFSLLHESELGHKRAALLACTRTSSALPGMPLRLA